MLKASENPPITWPEGESIRRFNGLWWVAHTKSRNEKALAHDLISKQISYFLPMTWKVRRHRGRTIRSLLPLFGGYLFFCGEENDRIELLRTNRVANLIEVKNQQKLLDELSQIEHALQAGAPLAPHRYIKAGQRCRVIAGPLADLQGIVVGVPKRKQSIPKGPDNETISAGVSSSAQKQGYSARLVLQIDMLGQAASVEIDTDMIEILENE